MNREPDIGDLINLRQALTFFGISAPMREELALRYEEYQHMLMSAVYGYVRQLSVDTGTSGTTEEEWRKIFDYYIEMIND